MECHSRNTSKLRAPGLMPRFSISSLSRLRGVPSMKSMTSTRREDKPTTIAAISRISLFKAFRKSVCIMLYRNRSLQTCTYLSHLMFNVYYLRSYLHTISETNIQTMKFAPHLQNSAQVRRMSLEKVIFQLTSGGCFICPGMLHMFQSWRKTWATGATRLFFGRPSLGRPGTGRGTPTAGSAGLPSAVWDTDA